MAPANGEGSDRTSGGARTSTTGTGSGQAFKPGIDFYSDASGRKGQAAALEAYADSHNVRAVVVMIGANNYGFAAILERRLAMRNCLRLAYHKGGAVQGGRCVRAANGLDPHGEPRMALLP